MRPSAHLTFRPDADYLLGWRTGAHDVERRLGWIGGRHTREMSVLGLLVHCDRVLAESGPQPYIEGLRDAYLTALEG